MGARKAEARPQEVNDWGMTMDGTGSGEILPPTTKGGAGEEVMSDAWAAGDATRRESVQDEYFACNAADSAFTLPVSFSEEMIVEGEVMDIYASNGLGDMDESGDETVD